MKFTVSYQNIIDIGNLLIITKIENDNYKTCIERLDSLEELSITLKVMLEKLLNE